MTRAPQTVGGLVAGPPAARRLHPILLPLALAAFVAAPPPPAAAQTARTEQAAPCADHLVRSGDALGALARRYGVEGGAAALLALNADRVADADSIRVGQRLRLPCPDPPSIGADVDAEDAAPDARSPDAPADGDFAAAPGLARPPSSRPADPADAAEAGSTPSDPAAPPDPRSPAPAASVIPLRAVEAPEEVPGANPDADARLAAALAEAPSDLSAAAPGADAPRQTDDGPFYGALVYPWVRPDCDRLERLPPDLAARCTRYDFSAPLATARIAWFARADAPALTAGRPADLRGLTLCRPKGMFDGDLAAAGLAPPRAARLAPDTARDCLDAVASGEADVASLEARDARRARAQAPPLPDITELPALASRVTLHAAARRGSPAGRAALASLNAGLAALRDRQAPEERRDGDR